MEWRSRPRASVIAMGSKFLIRSNGKHLFNPSAFAIVVLLLTTSQVWVVRDGAVTREQVAPEDVGLTRAEPDALRGGDRAHNAEVTRRFLAGEDGPVLVEVMAVGVCGTDVDILAGRKGWAPPGKGRLILGHESLGRVIEAPGGSGLVAGDPAALGSHLVTRITGTRS